MFYFYMEINSITEVKFFRWVVFHIETIEDTWVHSKEIKRGNMHYSFFFIDLFAESPRPGDSEQPFSFQSHCHLCLPLRGGVFTLTHNTGCQAGQRWIPFSKVFGMTRLRIEHSLPTPKADILTSGDMHYSMICFGCYKQQPAVFFNPF